MLAAGPPLGVVTRLRRSAVVTLALCLAASGCTDPYSEPASRTPPSTSGTTHAAAAESTGDTRPLEPTPAPPIAVGSVATPSPAALARAYARAVVNWDWHTLANRLKGLRERSASALSADLAGAIRATRADESLARDRPASHGVVVAVSVQGRGVSRRLVVVTRERETASGVDPLGPATHRVYFGKARRIADGWRMVGWRRAP
jgi:hypothetical protein